MSLAMPLAPDARTAVAQRRGRFAVAPGRTLLLLICGGLGWVIPALWQPCLSWAILVWDLALAAAWAIDLWRLPAPAALELRREWETPLSLGMVCRVCITVTNRSSVPVRVALSDEIFLSAKADNLWLSIPPGQSREYSTLYTPEQRGDHETGPVYLRYTTLLGLAERWAVAPLGQKVRVYPSFEHTRKQSIYLARSRQIELQMRLMRQRGQGSEFEHLREYREYDELRTICWTATARRGKPVVKCFQAERSQAVWIVVDQGRLMRAQSGGMSKLDRAAETALALAQLALYAGDRVALLAYGSSVTQKILPGRGATQLRQMVEALALVREETPEADHLRAATTLMTAQKHRGLVVWITDLAESGMRPEVIDAAGHLLRRHALLFAAMGDPEIKAKGREEAENSLHMYQIAAAQEMANRRARLLEGLRSRGALVVDTAPGELSTAVLNNYLRIKERNMV